MTVIYLSGCLVSLIMCYILIYTSNTKPYTVKDYLTVAAIVSFSWVGVICGILVIFEEN